MRRRLSKRGWAIILGGVLVIIMGAFCARLISDKPAVTLNDPLTFNYQDKVTVASLVSEIRRGELLNGDELVNTQQLGSQQVIIKAKNHYGREFSYEAEITVKDITAPLIELPELIELLKGEQVDLLSYIQVTDNAGKAEVELVNGYDPEKTGFQNYGIKARDESGNESEAQGWVLIRENKNDKREYFRTAKGYTGWTENGKTYIEGLLVVNKTYGLPSSYGARGLTKDTSAAWKKLKEAAANAGITFKVLSAYRNYGHQEEVYNRKVAEVGEAQALVTSEKAGHSEHQAGIALDLNSFKESFADSAEFKWLNENCYKYGFIIRYPKGKTEFTGYVYEPWHITYVGESWAEIFYNGGNWISIEEYFGITSEYGGQ